MGGIGKCNDALEGRGCADQDIDTRVGTGVDRLEQSVESG